MAGKTKKRDKAASVDGKTSQQVKGHLGLRSSPFSPVSSKLSAQALVQDQMAAHYRMINSAKSTIDNGVPKAMLTCQKVKDRARRQHLGKGSPNQIDMKMSSSRPSSRASSQYNENIQYLNRLKEFDDDTLEVHASTGIEENYGNSSLHHPGQQRWQLEKTILEKSVRTPRPATQGDLLQTRSHAFTEPEKLFTPRTLKKKNVQSKISQFKDYNPPKKKAINSNQQATNKNESNLCKMNDNSLQTSEVGITHELLRSIDKRQKSRKDKTVVPPLDITADTDHMNWLREQAEKAQTRTERPVPPPRVQYRSQKEFSLNPENSVQNGTLGSTSRFNSMAEEELKYLDFIRDVTNDVLERGIFSNRTLKAVFEKHIEKRKNELKVSRMRELLDSLREDLGIPLQETQEEDNSTFSYKLKSDVSNSKLQSHGLSSKDTFDTGFESYKLTNQVTETSQVPDITSNDNAELRNAMSRLHVSELDQEQVRSDINCDIETNEHNVERHEEYGQQKVDAAQEYNDVMYHEQEENIVSQDEQYDEDEFENDAEDLTRTVRNPSRLTSLTSSVKFRKDKKNPDATNEPEMLSTYGLDSTVGETMTWGTSTSVWSEVSAPNPLNETHALHTYKTVHFEEEN